MSLVVSTEYLNLTRTVFSLLSSNAHKFPGHCLMFDRVGFRVSIPKAILGLGVRDGADEMDGACETEGFGDSVGGVDVVGLLLAVKQGKSFIGFSSVEIDPVHGLTHIVNISLSLSAIKFPSPSPGVIPLSLVIGIILHLAY